MYDLKDIALLVLAAVVALYFYRAVQARERVERIVRSHCRHADVQLLDDTVAPRRLWVRLDGCRPRLWRTWHFEYSTTGDDRREGQAFTLGRRIEVIRLDPQRLH